MARLVTHDKPYGSVARSLMTRNILESGTLLPKPIEYQDIDLAMFNWVDKTFNIVHEGKRIPTYKLFSTQRISEYAQSWQNLDDTGNLIINFKTITRENNPQKGNMNGGSYNIPGHHDIAMFYVPVLQENGTEAYDKYTMKQPFLVDFTYSVSIITNKYELLNEMNEQMHYEFNAITCYISPNDHPMPMTLDSITDESEYTIDDRKYYSQTYKIKVKAYIIRKEDMQIERIPSRILITPLETSIMRPRRKKVKENVKRPKVEFMDHDWRSDEAFVDTLSEEGIQPCAVPIGNPNINHVANSIEMTDAEPFECGFEEDTAKYAYKGVQIIIQYDDCTSSLSFIAEKDITLYGVSTMNACDVELYVNGERVELEEGLEIKSGDEVRVKVNKKNPFKESMVILVGYDKTQTVPLDVCPETSLDEDEYGDERYLLKAESKNA